MNYLTNYLQLYLVSFTINVYCKNQFYADSDTEIRKDGSFSEYEDIITNKLIIEDNEIISAERQRFPLKHKTVTFKYRKNSTTKLRQKYSDTNREASEENKHVDYENDQDLMPPSVNCSDTSAASIETRTNEDYIIIPKVNFSEYLMENSLESYGKQSHEKVKNNKTSSVNCSAFDSKDTPEEIYLSEEINPLHGPSVGRNNPLDILTPDVEPLTSTTTTKKIIYTTQDWIHNSYQIHPTRRVSSVLGTKIQSANSTNYTRTIAPTEFIIEEFTTNRAETSQPNSTTIENATWAYQGSKGNEESDETLSTTIDYPYSASIQRKGAHYTTGALLSKRLIITVAGEFYNVRETLKLYRARLGSVDCKRGGTIVPIKHIDIHPYYLYGKPNFDIALLKLAFEVQFNNFIRPIAISIVKGKVVSAKFMTTYWPRILMKGSILPQQARERDRYNSMRVSTQRLIPRDKCARAVHAAGDALNEASLCLRPVLAHHSVCMPDPGAPVIATDGIWGVTSGWVPPSCPNFTTPTIFTRLSSPSVRAWLDSKL